MEEQFCPRCKTTKYRNPALKLMVNVCGHALCENCIEALFVRGSGACIECGIPLRRANFRLQIFEDQGVEKEVDIRKKILRDFNKLEGDFPTLREYNDYLEEIETIIFNLVSNVNVEETKKQIDEYKRLNSDQIRKNKNKLSKDAEYIENLLEEEKSTGESRRKRIHDEENKEKKERKIKKDALIDELMYSDLPASHILSKHHVSEEQKSVTVKSEPVSTISYSTSGRGSTFMPLPKLEGESYCHTPLVMESFGPEPLSLNELVQHGYLNHIRKAADSEIGGGFHIKYAVQRAVQEALCGIFHGFDISETPSPAFSSSSSSDTKQDVEMT